VNDAWAVGDYYSSKTKMIDTLILHWDGAKWSKVRSPSPARRFPGNILRGVSATSAHRAWAVGWSASDTRRNANDSLILRWNGTRWSETEAPIAGWKIYADNYLYGVSMLSTTDAWAVGEYGDGVSGISYTLILHWDGEKWRRAPSPTPNPYSFNSLLGVVDVSPTDAFAAGMFSKYTLAMRWMGTVNRLRSRYRLDPTFC